MRWHKTLRLRLRSLIRSGRVEAELAEELQYHFEHLVDDYLAHGMSREDARHAARREMGAIEAHKEKCRDARGIALLDSIRKDVIYALRALRRSPAFSMVAILSLALGIGANTAIFSLWYGVLHSSLPGVQAPGELVILSNPDESGSWNGRTDGVRSWLTYEEFEQIRDHVDGFSGVMASQSSLPTWRVRVDGGAEEEASGRLVSGGFFQVLGAGPAIGRVFSAADDRHDVSEVVISNTYWQRRFGGRPDVLGRTLSIRTAALTVIGVAARGFIGETTGQQPDFWLPLRTQRSVLPDVDRLHDTPPEKSMWLNVFGRVKPGVTAAQVDAQANAVFRAGLESFYGAVSSERRREVLNQQLKARPASGGASRARSELAQSLTTLLAAVAVLLLIACANLANLLLARGAARTSEIALRLSLGASRFRVIRQLVTESLALAAAGGLAAVAVAGIMHGALVALLAESDSRFQIRFALDPVVLGFVAAATVGATVLFGVLPAWQATNADAGAALKDQNRGGGGSLGHLRPGRLLVGLQLALSLPLLVGAGLLARTVYNLQRADLGFRTERLLLARVDLREAGYEGERRERVLRDLAAEIRRIPGVQAASFSQLGVFTGGESGATVAVEGYVPKGEHDHESAFDVIGPGYFSTLGVPMRLGREIQDSDRGDAAKICVINEAFAAHYFASRNPIGMRITLINDASHASYEIVGVAGNARTQSLRGDVDPRFFVPIREPASSSNSPTLLVRTAAAGAASAAPAVRRTIHSVDAAIPVMSAVSIEEQIAPLTAQDRATAQLALVFGGVALALAAIGLYGVLSYGIARRTGEIAIRIALGAPSGRVIAMILRETSAVVLAGVAAGGGLAWAASRLIGSRLYGVAPQDPLTLLVATGLLLAVALSAAYVPAHRASRLNPIAALRHE